MRCYTDVESEKGEQRFRASLNNAPYITACVCLFGEVVTIIKKISNFNIKSRLHNLILQT